MAKLEKGTYSTSFSSGIACINAILGTLRQNDHIVVMKNAYGGTTRIITDYFAKFGLKYTLIDFNKQDIKKHITKTTKMILFESPTNPLLYITEIKKLVQVGKKNKIITVCDNTFATPIL